MHYRRKATDQDEPADAAALPADWSDDPAGMEHSMHGESKHSRPRSICLCVDDFGLHAGVNNAALRLAAMDRVHAITCMVGAPTWASWGRLLGRLNTNSLDIGLHLDLTEHPLLVRTRRPLPRLIITSQLRWLARAPLRAEIAAQFDAFEDRVGHAPAFVDGHQHVHQFPVIRTELVDELERRYGAFKPWLRSTRMPRTAAVDARTAWPERLKPRIIDALGADGLAALASQRGYPQNQSLLGVYGFQGGRRHYQERLAAWLAAAGDADLLVCHPSLLVAGADAGSDPLLAARDAEFQVLAGAEFGRMLDEQNICLRPMSKILSGPPDKNSDAPAG
jgi:predicted glycoside hydrolase/deacetylase ChbG (UPF0249 family)